MLKVTNRYSAFLVHLLISLGILAVLLAIIFFVWFPYDFIHAGGLHGLKILTGVDLVLGPLLTLIVFNRAKKSLKLDLSVVAIIQIVCMAIGLFLIYQQRPLVQLLADDSINIISAYDFKQYDTDTSVVKTMSNSYPKYIALDMKTLEKGQVFMDKFVGDIMSGRPYNQRTEKYIAMSDYSEEQYETRLSYIESILTEQQKKQIKELKQHNNCVWVPATSSHLEGFACINKSDGAVKLHKVSDPF